MNIVLNYCDIGKETLDYISDSTPYKQGLYSPGKHIPILPPEHFHSDKDVDYALLGAWNHAKEILGKEKEFVQGGGRFIVHYPQARIINPEEFKENENKNNQTIQNLTFGKIPEIETKKLKVFANEQGYLFETLRIDDEIFKGKFGQNLVSVVYPGIIKGLHLHEKQTDYTCCIKGNLKYIAAKQNSDGTSTIQQMVIGEKNPIMIMCPPGIWHGYTPVGNQEAVILHTMDITYNPSDDDTQRKEPFAFGDVWTPKHG
jgi:dTDP-4-dehydrorhamnose 3,5-epimerase-like enzyme